MGKPVERKFAVLRQVKALICLCFGEDIIDNVRTQGIRNLDFSIFKGFQIREGMRFEFHAEFFNFLNTPRFGRPGYWYGSDDFGKISSMANSPRRGQIGFRFVF